MNKMYMTARVKEFDADERTIVAVASSGKLDRHNEIVRANGWDLSEYLMNPILLTNHNANDVLRSTIGKILWIKKSKGELIFKAYLGKTGTGAEAYDLIADLGIAAFSVGFRELQSKQMFVSELEGMELESAKLMGLGKNDRVGVITKAKLFEISLVSLPADSYAMMKGNYEPTAIVKAGFTNMIKTKNLQETYKDIDFKDYMPEIEEKDDIGAEEEVVLDNITIEDIDKLVSDRVNEALQELQPQEEMVEIDLTDDAEYVEIDLDEIKLSLRKAMKDEISSIDINTIVKRQLARITGRVID